MKFISLLSIVLVFALSAAYAEKEPAILQFFPAPRVFPPEYRIHANFLLSRTSHEIILRTKEPNWLASYPQKTRGVVEYDELPKGQYRAIINDNDAKTGDKTFRIDLVRPGAEFHYEGTSVADEDIEDLPADGYVHELEDDEFRYRSSRFYRNQDRYPCNE
ncbi:hypothetical protein O0I10_004519 [Lichtheimia ornata]|uniref:DUF2846 domain-containing protein n=1 Tax=Lichtheimia ornata TaxID=688661 RepID=A0AAD7V7I7_9FUNG|nr:uncharacterized protein O0I10_004519 [Lichtheimia ornata]KAJ8659926.1 hypothetical protein O0I10_004519 [Lichtheimia ornata]